MPASYTHQSFGNIVITNINDKHIKEVIKNNINYYNIGLQGPDLLFFYHPLKHNSVNKLGNDMHDNIATDFFKRAKTIINNDQQLAYILGFINHFILDSTVHGYVEKTVKETNISHYAIERDLDLYYLHKDNHELNYATGNLYTINKEVANNIALFFNLSPEIIIKSLKSFKLLTNLLACKSKIKRSLLMSGMSLVKANSFKDMVMQEKECLIIKDNINYLSELYNEAISISSKEIIDYYYNEEISKRFNQNYL